MKSRMWEPIIGTVAAVGLFCLVFGIIKTLVWVEDASFTITDYNAVSIDPNDGIEIVGMSFDAPDDPNRLTDASIRLLCTSGRVCKVMGHQWEWPKGSTGRVGYSGWTSCAVCGKVRCVYHVLRDRIEVGYLMEPAK